MASGKKVLNGKVAIITGSSAGLGEEIAKHFAEEGANVSLTGRNKQALDKIAAECRALGAEVVITVGDISTDVVKKLIVKNTVDKFGKIDILVNNAGEAKMGSKIEDCDFEGFDKSMNVNLKAPYVMTAYATPHLKKTKGSIVNVSAIGSIKPFSGFSIGNISKAGLDMLTKCSAIELAPYDVNVNAVLPGSFETSYFRDDPEEVRKMKHQFFVHLQALKKLSTLRDLSSLVVYLASDAATFMTGTLIPIDGGATIYTPMAQQ